MELCSLPTQPTGYESLKEVMSIQLNEPIYAPFHYDIAIAFSSFYRLLSIVVKFHSGSM